MASFKKYKYCIGIDCGVSTGVCIYDREQKQIVSIATVKIHEAMEIVKALLDKNPNSVFVRVEDARLRKWFGNSGREQLQGAGSVKRDAKIWEDFLTDLQIEYEMVAPKNNKTKMDAGRFKAITGFKDKTNVHGRDAAMLVIGS